MFLNQSLASITSIYSCLLPSCFSPLSFLLLQNRHCALSFRLHLRHRHLFLREQLPLLGQDVATDGGVEAGAAASVYPCLFYCFVTSCFSSKVATACQRCGRHSNLGESFAHVSTLPRHWLQQSQPQRPGQLALERATRLYNRSVALVCEVC